MVIMYKVMEWEQLRTNKTSKRWDVKAGRGDEQELGDEREEGKMSVG